MFWMEDIRILILSTRLLYIAETKTRSAIHQHEQPDRTMSAFMTADRYCFPVMLCVLDGSRTLSVTIFNPLLVTWIQIAIAESLSLHAIASLEHMCRASHREQPLLAHHLDLE